MPAPAVIAPYFPPGLHSSGNVVPPYTSPRGGISRAASTHGSAPAGVGPFIPAASRAPLPLATDQVAEAEGAAASAWASALDDSAANRDTSSDAVGADRPESFVASPGTLPWIDAFLRSTPATPMRAVPTPASVESVRSTPASPPIAIPEDHGSVRPQVPDRDVVAFDQVSASASGRADADLFETEVGWAEPATAAAEPVVSAEDFGRAEHAEVVATVASEELALAAVSVAVDAAPEAEMAVGGTALEQEPGPSVGVGEVEPTRLESDVAPPLEEAAQELWPLADAADAFRDLSAQLEPMPVSPRFDVSSRGASDAPALSPWQDDDFVDVMPMPTARAAGDAWPSAVPVPLAEPRHDQETTTAPASAESIALATDSAEAGADDAASALERLALRMRAGELTVPSYDRRHGEPAALVAALAAILGVRVG